ncbi:hypothetical protein COB55_01170 [Candidatus Wolfebacteria bacterium]|nr:MAG: hypothetical protein COB55_01170 [Candidatus Wolfebacteria bacterium]
MIDQKIITYIKTEIAKGISHENVVGALTQAGWALENVQAHMEFFEKSQNSVPPPNYPSVVVQATPAKSWNVFIKHLFIFALYTAVGFFSERFGYLVPLAYFFVIIFHLVILITFASAEKAERNNRRDYLIMAVLLGILIIVMFGIIATDSIGI